MRDTLRELAEISGNVAGMETDAVRADQLRALSRVATQLALTATH